MSGIGQHATMCLCKIFLLILAHAAITFESNVIRQFTVHLPSTNCLRSLTFLWYLCLCLLCLTSTMFAFCSIGITRGTKPCYCIIMRYQFIRGIIQPFNFDSMPHWLTSTTSLGSLFILLFGIYQQYIILWKFNFTFSRYCWHACFGFQITRYCQNIIIWLVFTTTCIFFETVNISICQFWYEVFIQTYFILATYHTFTKS